MKKLLLTIFVFLGYLDSVIPAEYRYKDIKGFKKQSILISAGKINSIKQVNESDGDPDLDRRLKEYSKNLQTENLLKDPFGINKISAFGNYRKYTTKTFNELTQKAKKKANEGEELSQFDRDRMEYYGHFSGLTGKTNIPGTPLMVNESTSLKKIVKKQKAKNKLAKTMNK